MAKIPIKLLNHIQKHFTYSSTSVFALKLYDDVNDLMTGSITLSAFEANGYVYVSPLSSVTNKQDALLREELNNIKRQVVVYYNS